jgi:predicted metalloprotease
LIAATWLTLVCAAAPAHAEKRVALVVGNNRYVNLAEREQLQKAANDARAVGGALKGIGFEVIAGENLGRRALLGKLGELVQRLDPGDMAFFFFSGHGVAVDGVNYVLPADVPDIAAGQETLLKGEALSEPYIVSELTGRSVRVAIVVLDACRTNPFSRASGKGIGFAKGLAPPPQVTGVFSLYAAASGQTALDRLADGDPSPNSVFTRVLAPKLATPGLDLRDLAFEVRQEVARIAATAGHDQRPEDHDGTIGGRVYLAGAPLAGGQGAAVSDAERAERTWGMIQNTTSVAVIDDFIRRFGDVPIYGPLARAKREQLATLAEPPRSDAPVTAEQGRIGKPSDDIARFVATVSGNINREWTDIFAPYGQTYTKPVLVLYSQRTDAACGVARSAMGPFYCTEDKKIYLDISFLKAIENQFHGCEPGRSCQFSQAYVIAHLVGHHVQNLIGILSAVRAAQRRLGMDKAASNALQVNVELQADCLAGLWARHENERLRKEGKPLLIEPGDIEAALQTASAIGDDTLQRRETGRVVPDSFTHGSSADRQRWFSTGLLENSVPFQPDAIAACNTFRQ